MWDLVEIFEESFLFSCLLHDNYEKNLVNFFDAYMTDGPYGYTDGAFDVRVQKGDVVIDAGAWIGDFSAYAAHKGATVYAFEPVNKTFQLLQRTARLNNINNCGGGGIFTLLKKL
jgi:predicted RNA methylase